MNINELEYKITVETALTINTDETPTMEMRGIVPVRIELDVNAKDPHIRFYWFDEQVELGVFPNVTYTHIGRDLERGTNIYLFDSVLNAYVKLDLFKLFNYSTHEHKEDIPYPSLGEFVVPLPNDESVN